MSVLEQREKYRRDIVDEYRGLIKRKEEVEKMIQSSQYRNAILGRVSTSYWALLLVQWNAMSTYACILEQRAGIENIDLEA